METVWLAPVGLSPAWAPASGLEALESEAHELLAEVHTDVTGRAPELEVHEVLGFGDPRQVLLDVAPGPPWWSWAPAAAARCAACCSARWRSASPPRHLPAVVATAPDDGPTARGILVAVDGSARCAAPLEFAFQHASMHQLPLTVLHAYWDVRHAAAHAPGDQEGAHADEEELLSSPRPWPAWPRSTPTSSCAARSPPASPTWRSSTPPPTRSSSSWAPTTAAPPTRWSTAPWPPPCWSTRPARWPLVPLALRDWPDAGRVGPGLEAGAGSSPSARWAARCARTGRAP